MESEKLASFFEKHPKVVVIMRGLTGSGKSTIRELLLTHLLPMGRTCAIHSADNKFLVYPSVTRKAWNSFRERFLGQTVYMEKDGREYRFDHKKLGWAHNTTQRDFKRSLKSGIDVVIVDNTNILLSHYKVYAIAGFENDYPVLALNITPDSVEAHFKRNRHGVPRSTITSSHEIFSRHSIKETEYLDHIVTDTYNGYMNALLPIDGNKLWAWLQNNRERIEQTEI